MIHDRRYNVKASKQKGYTLIELMIASMLGLFVTAGAYTMYATNKSSIRLQSSMSEVQKNGRFLIDRISSRVIGSGYSGFYEPFTAGVDNVLGTPNDVKWNLSSPVFGYNDVTSGATIAGITGIEPGSDVLLLKSMVDTVGLVSATTGSMILNTGAGISAGNILVATDPDHASVFYVSAATVASGKTTVTITTSNSPAPGNTASLASTFGSDAVVGKLGSVMYFLKNGSNGRTALFEARLVTGVVTPPATTPSAPVFTSKELVSNVEGMQIVYGLDTTNDKNIDSYDTANNLAGKWGRVRNVGITLLLSSNENNVADANTYSYDSTRFTYKKVAAVTSADKRLRRVFTTHVSLPNL